jgi:FkbM family methyltransferase
VVTEGTRVAKDGIDWKLRAKALSERLGRTRRAVLDKGVIRGSLPVRARTLPHRSARPEARERERLLVAQSTAYRQAVEADASVVEHVREITVDGLAWWVPLLRPDDFQQVERALRHQDFPYRALTQTRDLAVGGAMIDIGANIGRMSIPRVILGDVTMAYCAEPDPLNYQCLVRNVRDNHLSGLVLPDCVALGATNGVVRFERSRTSGGHKVVDLDRVTRNETIEVPLATLDTWAARHGIDLEQVTFVKVDVQGSELQVLLGATQVLARRHIAWQIEIDPVLLRVGHSSPEDLFALLQRHFTHFIDLNREVDGDRARPIADLGDALAYVDAQTGAHTDVLVCSLDTAVSSHR